jgi:hypothetical protein
MKETFTKNDLVKYLYKDGDVLEILEIEAAVEESPGIRRRLSRLKRAKRMIPQVLFSPSNRCLDAVLRYSMGSHLAV